MTTILLPADTGAAAPPSGTVDWPTVAALRPSGLAIGVRPAASGWQAAYTRQRQSVSHMADRMTATVTLGPCRGGEDAGYREAFIDHLAERSPWVRLHHFARPAPLGTLRGTPTVAASASAGARSITVAGGTAGVNLLANSSFEWGSPLATGWNAYSLGTTGTISYSIISGVVDGSATQYIAAAGLGTTSADRCGLYADAALSAALTATTPCTASIYARGTAGSRIAVIIYAFDAGNALIGTATATDAALSDAAAFQRFECTYTLPVGTRTVRMAFWQHSSAVLGLAEMGADAAQLELAGAASTYSGVRTLLGGDMLGVGGRLLKVAYTGATESAAGLVVPLALPLRAAVDADDAVTWDRPTGTFQLENAAELQYLPGVVQQGFDLQFLEVV